MCSHQAEWREEVKQHFEKIKSEGTCLHRLDEELINRRREELRFVSLPLACLILTKGILIDHMNSIKRILVI